MGVSTARADAAQPVTLLIAAKDGRTPGVVAGVKALGGTVTEKTGSIGYVKAQLPAGNFGKVSALKSVKAVDVDRLIPFEDPEPLGQTDPIPQTAPGNATPRTNPYMPLQDTGADTFAANTDHDGRGTTIAILDTGVDLANPALQTTTTSAPKVIDWFDANPPGEDGTWVATGGRVSGQFSHGGDTWTAPAAGGPFAFGTLVEDRLDLKGGELGGDLDRDGIKGETIGVLQNRDTKTVLVDTDQDLDFTDESPMTNFPEDRDIGTLGEDDPGTAVVEQLSFSVRTDRSEYDPGSDEGSWVNIGIAGGSHGSHVAGITAANEMFGGAMGGAAPGAKIMAVQVCLASEGCLSSAMMDGMVYAAEHGADVANLSVGGLPALNDGNSATSELYNRLIDETGMQIFIAAGNEGSGANTVGEPGNTSEAVSVGASIAKETWLSNYGATVDPDQMLMPFSSRGPSESGAMKPDLVAPGSAVSTIQPWLPGSPVAGTFGLPPGYAMYNGTSMASPQATGAAALLVGAYKHEFGSAPAPEDLRNAMISTAGFLPGGVPAHGQGTGLIDVDAAWTQLSQVDPVEPATIKAAVPVNSVLSEYLDPPGTGSGIYEREGLKTGDVKTRTYTLTRTTGDPGGETFDIGWKGNDGTFTAGSTTDPVTSVTLPLNSPVQLPVEIKPTSDGIHSAVMQLNDPATNGIDLNTQNVAFSTAGPGTDWSIEESGTVGRGAGKSVLIDVPEGASALRVELTGGGPTPAAGQVRFQRLSPSGEQLDPIGTSECFIPATRTGCSVGQAAVRVVEDPAPGVWEIAVEGGYRSSIQDSPWDLTATVLDASVSPETDHIRTGNSDPVERSYDVTNSAGSFKGTLAGGSLASTRIERATISGSDLLQFEIDVPNGAESVSASVGNPSNMAADIDLYLFRCGAECVQVGGSGNADSEESVSLADPPPGDYVAAVDPYDLQGDSLDFDYRDSFTSSEIGEVTTDDETAERNTGDSWTVGATITPGEVAPAEGRTITGGLKVLDESGNRIGGASITLDIDTTAPKVEFTTPVPARGTDRTPTFEFASDDPDATFECRIDDGAWAACTSPHTTAELSVEDDHTFAVRATDDVGNTGEASADFTVVAEPDIDTTAPKVEFTAPVPARGTDRTPTFEFASDDPDATFECRIDDGAWAACTSPHTTPELSDGLEGDHTFAVRATDDVGNTGEASADFVVVADTMLEPSAASVRWRGVATRISPSAILRKTRDGEAIAGQTIRFQVGRTAICQSLTDDSGVAKCSGTVDSFNPRARRSYRAVFAGRQMLEPATANGALKKRTGKAPDRRAPRFIGKIRLKPHHPKARQRARVRFRSSERAKLTVRVGRRVVQKTVTRRWRSVRLPRLKRGRHTARLVLTDRAKNRSKTRKIRFRVR